MARRPQGGGHGTPGSSSPTVKISRHGSIVIQLNGNNSSEYAGTDGEEFDGDSIVGQTLHPPAARQQRPGAALPTLSTPTLHSAVHSVHEKMQKYMNNLKATTPIPPPPEPVGDMTFHEAVRAVARGGHAARPEA